MTDRGPELRVTSSRAAGMEGHVESLEVLDGRRFQIVVRRLADALTFGSDHSPWLGSGIEYVQSRPYEPGDPVRSIDWRVTARTGRFHVKEFESPKRMPVYLLIDTSASMLVSSVARSKYVTALHLAGGLALACLDRVSPVGVLAVGEQGLRIRPSLSRAQVMQWLLGLRRVRFDESTQLARRLGDLLPSLAHRALIIVLSDLHDEGAVDALKLAGQRHDVAVVQLRDPAERDLKGAGLLRAREAETGREFFTHGRRAPFDQAAVDQGLREGAVDHLLIDTDRPYVHEARRFFGGRGLVGRLAR